MLIICLLFVISNFEKKHFCSFELYNNKIFCPGVMFSVITVDMYNHTGSLNKLKSQMIVYVCFSGAHRGNHSRHPRRRSNPPQKLCC